MTRLLVVGLDALDPVLVDRWLPELPTIRELTRRGIHGPLESIVQPVTPVAWPAMTTGRNPGWLGFTDFLHRPAGRYGPWKLVHSRLVEPPTLYRRAAAAGLRATMVGVPLGYPPERQPGGVCVSCFMAPREEGIVEPRHLQAELLAQTGQPYLLDVTVTEREAADRTELAARLRTFDAQRFDLAAHLWRTTACDVLFVVCMGTDRAGHYFMRHVDPEHRRYDPDPRHAEAMLDQYRYCDRRLGELIELAGPDTAVMVVSDHGMQRLDGRVHLNEWLMANGYLVLAEPPEGPLPVGRASVDWRRTRAWAQGYGGQLHFNVRGREERGCVEPERVDELARGIVEGLRADLTHGGRPIPVTAVHKRDLYSGPHVDRCPDLCLQMDGLRFLAADAVGGGAVVRPADPAGIDDGSHAPYGFLALSGPGVPAAGRFHAMHLLDVLPTLLDLLGLPDDDLEGQALHRGAGDAYSDAEEEQLANRLRSLYLE